MKIIFQDREILIEPKKLKTTVKELLKNLRTQIDSPPNEELALLGKKPDDENYVSLDDHTEIDLDSGQGNQEYILVTKQYSLEPIDEKQKTETIEKTVMLVTNAKEQINTSKATTKKRSVFHHDDGQLEYFEQMIRSGVLPNSTRLRSEIANLLNLQNLSTNDTSGQGQNPYFGFNFNNLGNPVISQTTQSSNNQSTANNQTNQTSNNSNVISISSNPNTTSLPNLIPSSLPVRRARPPTIEPNPEHVQFLMDMGFEEARAKRALIASKNNLNHATEMILNGYDLDLPESGLHSGKIFSKIGNYSQILFDSVQMPQLEVQNMQVTNDNNPNNNSQE